jgi:G3E family GTPase
MGKCKATILTGFLGAGKTTLLNHLIGAVQGERIAIIVNEYGEVGIDGQLVVETEDELIELNNGCICCTVRGDLIGAIGKLLASGRPVDRIIIETSGLADPAPVIQSFVLDETLSRDVDLDAIVTVVDSRHVMQQLTLDEAAEQIAFADVLLLNKVDLEPESTLAAVQKELRARNPLARIIRTQNSRVAREAVLDLGAFDLKNLLTIAPDLLDEHDHEHDQSIGCIAIQMPGAVDGSALNGWLNRLVQAKGRDLFRIKGILHLAGEPRRFVFHGVHMTMEGRPGRPWLPGEMRANQIVFIGRNLDEAAIRQGFEACLVQEHALAS